MNTIIAIVSVLGVVVAGLVWAVLVMSDNIRHMNRIICDREYFFQCLKRDHEALRKEFDALADHLKVQVVEEPATRPKMRVLDFNQ